MRFLNTRAPVITGVERNCHLCGKDWTDWTDTCHRVCPDCRKPRSRSRRELEGAPPLLLREEVKGKPLTLREQQLAGLVTEGKSNKEIARILHLGEGTIKAYVSIVLAKTESTNRTALATWWYKKTKRLAQG